MTYEKHGDMIYLENGDTYVHMNQFNKIGSYLLEQRRQTDDMADKVIDRNIHIDNLEDTIRKLHKKIDELQIEILRCKLTTDDRETRSDY